MSETRQAANTKDSVLIPDSIINSNLCFKFQGLCIYLFHIIKQGSVKGCMQKLQITTYLRFCEQNIG